MSGGGERGRSESEGREWKGREGDEIGMGERGY